jgi:hypothetical protein
MQAFDLRKFNCWCLGREKQKRVRLN